MNYGNKHIYIGAAFAPLTHACFILTQTTVGKWNRRDLLLYTGHDTSGLDFGRSSEGGISDGVDYWYYHRARESVVYPFA
jgi:hypothetical protein